LVVNVQVEPAPSDEEAAALVVALEALWPKPVAVTTAPRVVAPAWRFSGRWWTGTAVVRRSRP
jgi:hypothetical protein